MSQQLQAEIEGLKKQVLALSAEVEENFKKAVRSVQERDARLAREVIDSDVSIDQKEVDVEEECLKILALHQPVAIDLRFIVAVLKLNNDLERIGDLAVNVAERGVTLAEMDPIEEPETLQKMATCAIAMVHDSLDSLVNLDLKLARAVCASDDAVDAMHAEMYGYVQTRMQREPHNISRLIHLLTIARYLERAADHATNIAEDVIYMVEGHIVRHQYSLQNHHAGKS